MTEFWVTGIKIVNGVIAELELYEVIMGTLEGPYYMTLQEVINHILSDDYFFTAVKDENGKLKRSDNQITLCIKTEMDENSPFNLKNLPKY